MSNRIKNLLCSYCLKSEKKKGRNNNKIYGGQNRCLEIPQPVVYERGPSERIFRPSEGGKLRGLPYRIRGAPLYPLRKKRDLRR